MKTACPGIGPRLLLLVVSAAACCRGEPAGFKLQPSYQSVVPGLDYANIRDAATPMSIHVARLERSRQELEMITTLGRGRVQGLSTLSEQVAAVPSGLGRPLIAVNGDFFVEKPGPYQGDPGGLQIVGGELVSAPDGHSFWAEPGGQVHIGMVYTRLEVIWPDATRMPMGLNQAPPPNGATLFTAAIGASTRVGNGVELILEKGDSAGWLPLCANQIYAARVREIRPFGDTPISSDTAVLSLTGQATNRLAGFKPGDRLQFSTEFSKDLSRASAGIGGSMELIENGKQSDPPPARTVANYLFPRHPRTAVGFDERYLYLVVVDGRQKGVSEGMSTPELAAFMLQLGCKAALNLDGGGSTTFWLDGRIANSPSDKFERPLANALVIVRKPAGH